MLVIHRLSDWPPPAMPDRAKRRSRRGCCRIPRPGSSSPRARRIWRATREMVGLTGTEVDHVATLPRGVALWKVGERSFVVEHRLSAGRARPGGHRCPHAGIGDDCVNPEDKEIDVSETGFPLPGRGTRGPGGMPARLCCRGPRTPSSPAGRRRSPTGWRATGPRGASTGAFAWRSATSDEPWSASKE